MGILNKLFGPPSKDKFAKMVMTSVRQKGEMGKVVYDPNEFRLVVDGEKGTRLFLSNAYYEYCTAPRKERPEILQKYVRNWFVGQKEMPEDFADIKPDLMPIVRSRSYYELNRQRVALDGSKTPDWAYQILNDYLVIGLVYDMREAIRTIHQDDLDKWGVTFYEALEIARDNLSQLPQQVIGPADGEGVYLSAMGDSYDSSRLLLLDLIRQFKVKGDPIAMVPNRNALIVAGSEDVEGLKGMLALAKDAMQKPYTIGGIAMRLDGEDWVTWLPDPSHPLYKDFRLLQIQTYGQEYDEQMELLNKLHEKKGEDIFVASYSAMENKENGNLLSCCVWSKNVLTLLPKTDLVAFIQEGAKPRIAEWDRVVETVGNLMEPLDMYPPRWRVSEYPTDEQLALIGKEI